MNDVPAQFRLNGLLWLTALVGFLCAIARAVPIDEFRVLIVILVLMFAPLVIVTGANYLLFFLHFDRRMGAADVLLSLLVVLTLLLGLAVGCFGVVVAAVLILAWLPQLFLYWEWKDVKRSEYGIGCDIAEPDERAPS